MFPTQYYVEHNYNLSIVCFLFTDKHFENPGCKGQKQLLIEYSCNGGHFNQIFFYLLFLFLTILGNHIYQQSEETSCKDIDITDTPDIQETTDTPDIQDTTDTPDIQDITDKIIERTTEIGVTGAGDVTEINTCEKKKKGTNIKLCRSYLD